MKYNGSCLCGNNKFEIIGEFESFYLCHCNYCRKDSGSSNGSNLFSNNAKLNWSKGGIDIKIYNLPKTKHTKCFCNNCGSALPYVIDGTIVVPTGSLDGKVDFQIDAHIFYKSRVSWYDSLNNTKKFDALPK